MWGNEIQSRKIREMLSIVSPICIENDYRPSTNLGGVKFIALQKENNQGAIFYLTRKSTFSAQTTFLNAFKANLSTIIPRY